MFAVRFVRDLVVLFLRHRMRHGGLIAGVRVRLATADHPVDRDGTQTRRAVILGRGVGVDFNFVDVALIIISILIGN